MDKISSLANEVLRILDDALNLKGRTSNFTSQTPLLGALPELDSMAVISLITALEERFEITIEDDDLNGDNFFTVGTLVNLMREKVAT